MGICVLILRTTLLLLDCVDSLRCAGWLLGTPARRLGEPRGGGVGCSHERKLMMSKTRAGDGLRTSLPQLQSKPDQSSRTSSSSSQRADAFGQQKKADNRTDRISIRNSQGG